MRVGSTPQTPALNSILLLGEPCCQLFFFGLAKAGVAFVVCLARLFLLCRLPACEGICVQSAPLYSVHIAPSITGDSFARQLVGFLQNLIEAFSADA